MPFSTSPIEIVQITGALLVLICFLLAQAERISTDAYPYLLLNLIGSAAMTVTAVVAHAWGFVFLEGVWALFSAWGLVQRVSGRSTGGAP